MMPEQSPDTPNHKMQQQALHHLTPITKTTKKAA